MGKVDFDSSLHSRESVVPNGTPNIGYSANQQKMSLFQGGVISSSGHLKGGIELEYFSNGGSRMGGINLPSENAVVVCNAGKSYQSNQPVLNGLNMTVPCGSIYGLLGSSGCGKTTMLSCIVGISKLDQGNIWIFGEKPGTKSIGIPGRNVGYMPQEISLYTEFSIAETLSYFGALTGMSKWEIWKSTKFLAKLLNLPKLSSHVGSLSGGEQRRVSLVVALLSGPDLLILDEPTVGVDPLVRENIWLHLKQLAQSQRTTVIITTHYIEECRAADNIGVMRNGRLLAERSPKELMLEHETNSLEKVVLHLSKLDTMTNQQRYLDRSFNPYRRMTVDQQVAPANMARVSHESSTGFKEDTFKRMKALMRKNFFVLLRNPLLLFLDVLIAAVQMILISISLSHEPQQLAMGLVNNEVSFTNWSCSNYTQIAGECNFEMLGCRYASYIKKDAIDLVPHDTEFEAALSVHSGSSWGYISVPANFSISLFDRISTGANVDDLAINSSTVFARLDESSRQISVTIKIALFTAYSDFIKQLLIDCGYDPRLGKSALNYQKPIFGNDTSDFREFIAPAVALAILYFFPIVTTSIRYIRERRSGVLNRSIVGGVRTWEIMVAYSISAFWVLLLQSVLTYGVITIVFQMQVLGSHGLVLILFLLASYGGVAMGFLMGTVCTEEIQAAILAIAVFVPNMILCGLVWPREGMVLALQYIVPVLPCTLAADAARSIISRGWEFTHPGVWPGFAILVGYIVGYFILTVLFHKLRKG